MTAREFLMDYLLNHPDNHNKDGKPFTDNLTRFFREIGRDYKSVESEGDSRWWTNLFVVQEINGRLIGYGWASTTGDNSIWDAGWEFDEDSICFVEPYEVTMTKYRKIDE